MSQPKQRPQPLAGITVLDLTQIFNGPYCTLLMALSGAEVIKIEPPGGEISRNRPNVFPFVMLNSNKQSMVINLKTAQGKELLLSLAEKADVVVENFAPGVMDRLGVGYAALSARNPRIILASGSGFGSSGPYRDYPAMDIVIQAISGAVSITGFPDGPPVKAGPAICDFFGGIHLYGAIMTALLDVQRNGHGHALEVAMLDATFYTLGTHLGMFFATGNASRTGNRHGGMTVAPYNIYPTRDGYITIMCNSEKDWLNFLKAVGKEELAKDPRFLTIKERSANMDALDEIISDLTRLEDKQPLFERLVKMGFPVAPVRDVKDLVNDPHLHQRGMLSWQEHPRHGCMPIPGSPFMFHGLPRVPHQPDRPLGADTDMVLKRRLGLDDASIAALHAGGVI